MTEADKTKPTQSPKMNPVVKQMWLEALRSNKYKQGIEALVDQDGNGEITYCCLGVLCKAKSLKMHKRLDISEYWQDGDELLDRKTLEWAGLYCDTQEKLAAMNDDGFSFEYIADWIDQNL